MNRISAALCCALAFAWAAPTVVSAAPAQVPLVKDSAGRPIPAVPVICVDATGTYLGCGGAGGGSTLPSVATSSPPTYTEGAPVPSSTDLAGNMRVRIVGGTLPSFGSTQTFNLGTLNGAATSAKQDTAQIALDALKAAIPLDGSSLPDVPTKTVQSATKTSIDNMALDIGYIKTAAQDTVTPVPVINAPGQAFAVTPGGPTLCQYDTSPSGQAAGSVIAACDSYGHPKIGLYNPSTNTALSIIADGSSSTVTATRPPSTAQNKMVTASESWGFDAVNSVFRANLSDPLGNQYVVGTKLNDGTVTATGGTHITTGGVGADGNYHPFLTNNTGGQLVTPAADATGTASFKMQGSSASAAADDGSNPVKIGGKVYATAPTTYSSADRVEAKFNNTGSLYVTEGGKVFSHISTATSTVLASRAGFVAKIVVGTAGAGSNATLYNNTTCTGTVVGVFDTSTARTITLDAYLGTGMCLLTAGGTPADLTVTYN